MSNDPSIERIAADYGALLKRIASAHEADPGLTEELIQETLLAIWRALPTHRGDASLKTFVARIAINKAVDHVRRALRRVPAAQLSLQEPDPHEGPEWQLMASDDRDRLLHAVQRLPMAYRQTALLTLEGLSGVEVARVLGISANAVAIRLLRAKSLLRTLLGDMR